MQLFRFYCNGETDWIAANDDAEARKVYMSHYGLHEADMDGVRHSVETNPDDIEIYTDDHDYEADDPEMPTAADIMAKMKAPGLVASTVQ